MPSPTKLPFSCSTAWPVMEGNGEGSNLCKPCPLSTQAPQQNILFWLKCKSYRYKTQGKYSERIYLLCPFNLLPSFPKLPFSILVSQLPHAFYLNFLWFLLVINSTNQFILCLLLAFHDFYCISLISVYTWLYFSTWVFHGPVSQIIVSSSWTLFNNAVYLSLSLKMFLTTLFNS